MDPFATGDWSTLRSPRLTRDYKRKRGNGPFYCSKRKVLTRRVYAEEDQQTRDAEKASLELYQQEKQEDEELEEAKNASLESLQQERQVDRQMEDVYQTRLDDSLYARQPTFVPPPGGNLHQDELHYILPGIEQYWTGDPHYCAIKMESGLKGGSQSGYFKDRDDDVLSELGELMSSVTPKTSPRAHHKTSGPFRFLDCEPKVRDVILQHALTQDHMIEPYYRIGSLELGAKDHDSNEENYDISILLATAGSPTLYDQARTALYGSNHLHFDDPRLLLWWLKAIGSNIRRVRNLSLTLSEGEVLPGDAVSIRQEKIWYNALVWLKSRHRLHNLDLDFGGWKFLKGNRANTDSQIEDSEKARHDVYRTLLKYRELKEVRVEPGPWLKDPYASILERAMSLGIGESREEIRDAEDLIRGNKSHPQVWSMK